jgi:hypothetical protein
MSGFRVSKVSTKAPDLGSEQGEERPHLAFWTEAAMKPGRNPNFSSQSRAAFGARGYEVINGDGSGQDYCKLGA